MLQVSERAHYGLRAMTELAKSYGQGLVPLARIATVEGLPAGYLEQLAMPLRRAGLIEGHRGVRGGYELAVPPAEVTVGAVLRALEGPVAPVECLAMDYIVGSCEREAVCLSQSVWRRVKESVDKVLDSMTLADLCRPQGGQPMGRPELGSSLPMMAQGGQGAQGARPKGRPELGSILPMMAQAEEGDGASPEACFVPAAGTVKTTKQPQRAG